MRLKQIGYKLDFTHTINHLSFGDIGHAGYIEQNFDEHYDFELDNTTVL